MNLEKADFFTVIQFGNKEHFEEKLKIEHCELSDIMNLRDSKGISLLSKSLINRKYDIAQILINCGVNVNIVSKDNCNELHYLIANINIDESLSIAKQLIEMGVDLNLPDKRYANTPFWYLCQKAIQINSQEMFFLIKVCMKRQPDLDRFNIAGNTIRNMVLDRGSENLKNIILEAI